MENKKIVAIIQARMGSTRLPGKVLINIEGKPILEHIIDRLHVVDDVDEVVVATSVKHEDDAIVEFCKNKNIHYIRGSEENVLERFGIASKEYPADIYIRATGDNPMIDVTLISNMLSFFKDRHLSYSCYKKYPIGSGVEMFTREALCETLSSANESYELEHVTPYMYQKMKDRNIEFYTSDIDESSIRMTIDTESDLTFAREIYRRLYNENNYFGITEIKYLLEKEPSLATINSNVHQKKLGE